MKLPLAVAALIGLSTAARADHPPESGAGWLRVRTGLSFADTLTLDSAVGLETNGDPGLVLSIGAHWRTSRLDFGALFESLASWSFPGVARDQRVGSQFRAAAHLRWRYIEGAWGALYLSLSPGVMAFSHSPQLRVQASQTLGASNTATDTHTLGFSIGIDFGVLLYLTDNVALALNLELLTSTTSIDTSGGPVDLDMVRGLITVGVEWHM